MCASKVQLKTLRDLEPIAALSEDRLDELAALGQVQSVSRNSDPFQLPGIRGQIVYLIRGELALGHPDSFSRVLVGGSDEARYPLGLRGEAFVSAKAITDVELIRFDNELIDMMMTWDQVANPPSAGAQDAGEEDRRSLATWSILSGMFSVSNLKYGTFAGLPSPHIEELLSRFRRINVGKGEVIIREGAEGDFYYVIETGRSKVERMVGGVVMLLADLKSGDAFGEEALVSEAKRNATVTMKSDGVLLRLAKTDFNELLREPMLHRVSAEEGRQKIAGGGQWVDVRYPSEYQYDGLPGAISIPLSEIRNAIDVLDRGREYVLYCQSERRSAAATFLLAQRGYRAFLLTGGVWGREGGSHSHTGRSVVK